MTTRQFRAIKPGMKPVEVNEARQAAIRAIQGEATPGVSRQAVSLYAGALQGPRDATLMAKKEAVEARLRAGLAKTPEARAADLVDKTRLTDTGIVTLLRAGGGRPSTPQPTP